MIEIKVIVAMLCQRLRLKLVPGQTIMADAITRLPKYGILVEVACSISHYRMIVVNRCSRAPTSTRSDCRRPSAVPATSSSRSA